MVSPFRFAFQFRIFGVFGEKWPGENRRAFGYLTDLYRHSTGRKRLLEGRL